VGIFANFKSSTIDKDKSPYPERNPPPNIFIVKTHLSPKAVFECLINL
jgi:hypothetical protein